jgi:ribonuclease PH
MSNSDCRRDGRQPDELRPISVQRGFTRQAAGSVLFQTGGTVVLCTASIEESVPPWFKPDSTSGWLTAEYSMLPGSTRPRKPRERAGKVDSRGTEIQRLIGRSLRAVVDMAALGRRTVTVDCDVLQADGGTRTASITGGFIALVDAISTLPVVPGSPPILTGSVAAVSVGRVDGRLLLDLDYSEDNRADVDFNVVMTGGGEFVEVQGTAEGAPFSYEQLQEQVALARRGIEQLSAMQRDQLGPVFPQSK